jgi:hypothetical protein
MVRLRAHLRDRLRELARDESGFIVVIIMLLLVIALLAGAAALAESLNARDSASRSGRSARALQAADAGIQTELYRVNQLNLGSLKLSSGLSLSSIINQLLTCPVPQVNAGGQLAGITFTAIASVGSPCPTNSKSGTSSPLTDNEPVGHHAYYQVQFIPGTSNVGDFVTFNPKIVATGFDDNGNASNTSGYVTRRVEAILAPVTPWRTLEAAHDLTIDVPPALSALGIKLAGATAFNGTAAAGNNLKINGTAALANTFTATGISLSGGLTAPSALDYCNTYTTPNVTVSLTLGNVTKPASGCAGLVNRSPVQISSSKPNCAPNSGVVACSTLTGFGASYYNAAGDSYYCTSSCPTLTFAPGDYVFCDFQTAGTVNLNPDSLHAVRIFIDSPSSTRCKNFTNHSSPPTNFHAGAGNFVATHGVGNVLGVTHPSQAQVYVVGNGTNDGTYAYTTGDTTLSSQDLFLYAPTSNVTVYGGQTCILGTCVNTGTVAGSIIGYDVDVSGTAVASDLGLLNYPLSSTLGPFYVKQYIECTPQYPLPSPDPTSGC